MIASRPLTFPSFLLFLTLVSTLLLPAELDAQSSVRFLENKGQIADMQGDRRPDILFMASTPGMRLYMRKTGLSYVYHRAEGLPDRTAGLTLKYSTTPLMPDSAAMVVGYRVDMELLGSNPEPRITREGTSTDYSNYYLAHCPEGVTDVRSYSAVTYHDVYPNIDLVFHQHDQGIKYDFIVRPGGRVSDIRMKYFAADDIKTLVSGGLKILSPMGTIEEGKPYSYIEGSGHEVATRYRVEDDVVRFVVGSYDGSRPLVIDPMLNWSTFYGGGNYEYAFGGWGGGWGWSQSVTVDTAGNICASSSTGSTDFPISTGAYQTTFRGQLDVALVKMSATGSRVWATFLGGSQYDYSASAGGDSAGNIVVCGTTLSTDFPVSSGAYQGTNAGNYDLFLFKMSSAGTRIWATYFGGNNFDWTSGVAVDGAWNIVVVGSTVSTGLATSGAFQTTHAGNYDMFVMKWDSGGTRLWSSYLGGSGQEYYGCAVSTDPHNQIYVAGQTSSANFPVTTGAFQTSLRGTGDGSLTKFSPSGTRIWGTYIGGSDVEYSASVVADADSNLYVTGYTYSGDIPTTSGAFQTSAQGGGDGYILKFNAAGNKIWGTYYGGNSIDWLSSIAVDPYRNIVVSAYTYSTNFPVTTDAYQSTPAGFYDNGIVKFDSAGRRLWATYLGGSSSEYGSGVIFDRQAIIVSGSTASANFPVTSGAFQTNFAGNWDLFISKFCDIRPRLSVNGPLRFCPGDSVLLSIPGEFDRVSWSTGSTARTITVKQDGTYWLRADMLGCVGYSDTIRVVVNRLMRPTIGIIGTAYICEGDSTAVEFTTNAHFRSIRWSTGDTTRRIKITQAGRYHLTAMDTSGCYTFSDSIDIFVNARPQPTIALTGSREFCEGDSAILDAGPGHPLYLWSNGATTQRIVVKQSGTYSVRVTSAAGCVGFSPSMRITVHPAPVSKITALTSLTFCEGGNAILTGPPGFVRYRWSTGDTTQRITVNKEGPITLTVTDSNGCSAVSPVSRAVIMPRPAPRVTPSRSIPFCEGDSVVLTAEPGFKEYRWSTGESGPQITVTKPGRYSVSVDDFVGCTGGSDTISVTVEPRPRAVMTGPTAVCANSTATYTVPDSSNIEYAWTVSSGGTITSGQGTATLAVKWGSTASERVTLRMTNKTTRCFVDTSITVDVGASLVPQVSTNRRPTICPGDSVTLDAGSGYTNYQWSTGATTQSITVKDPGSYTVTVTNADGCSGPSTPITVTIATPPQPSIVTPMTRMCEGDTITLDGGSGYSDYLWSNGMTSRSIRVTDSGSYSLMVTDSNGCTGAAAPIEITLEPRPTPLISGPRIVCRNSTAQYSAPSIAGHSYNWDVVGGTITGGNGTSTITVQWGGGSVGSIGLDQTSTLAACVGTAPRYDVSLGDSIEPSITSSGSTELCVGSSVTLDAGTGYTSYRWSTGETSQTITVDKAGQYSVWVSEASGCAGTSQPMAITVRPEPRPSIQPSGIVEICPGDSVTLTAPAGYRSYLWSDGVSTSRSITIKTPGTYSVAVIDDNGCPGRSDTMELRQFAAPAVPTVTMQGDTMVSSPATGYQWNRNGTPITGATSQRLVDDRPGNYSVTITNDNGCRATSGLLEHGSSMAEVSLPVIEAVPGERIQVPILLNSSHNLDAADAIEFTSTIRFNSTLLLPTDTALFGAVTGGQRTITVKGSRPAGMQTGELGRIEMIAALGNALSTPLEIETFIWTGTSTTVTTQNGEVRVKPNGGWELYLNTGTLALEILPNPAEGEAMIKYETIIDGRVTITVVDALGRTIATVIDQEKKAGPYAQTIDVRDFPNGAYFLKMRTPAGDMIRMIVVRK